MKDAAYIRDQGMLVAAATLVKDVDLDGLRKRITEARTHLDPSVDAPAIKALDRVDQLAHAAQALKDMAAQVLPQVLPR